MKEYSIEDIANVSIGASFLGSGGGGAFKDSQALLEKIKATGKTGIILYNVDDAEEDDLLCVAGGIGAPDALAGRVDDAITAIGDAIDKLSANGKSITGILSVESGAVNTMLAVLLSIKKGLKLFNCDGAGRAIPTIANLTYAHEPGFTLSPVALVAAGVKSDVSAILTLPGAEEAEKLIRPLITDPVFNEMGGLALWRQTGSELKASHVVRDTFTTARTIGEIISTDPTNFNAIVDGLKTKGFNIQFSGLGTLKDARETTAGGFDRGLVDITVHAPGNGAADFVVSILNQNENLLAYFSNESQAVTAPNLMCYLVWNEANGKFEPMTNGDNLKDLVGVKIGLVFMAADAKLYNTENGMLDSFCKVLGNLGYYGSIFPNPFQSGNARKTDRSDYFTKALP